MNYEEGREKLEALVQYFHENSGDRNEATTRLHLIDRLFFECLGWSKDDCVAEESQDGLYADYTFSTTSRVLMSRLNVRVSISSCPQESGQKSMQFPLCVVIMKV